MKACKVCAEEKPDDAFNRYPTGTLYATCQACRTAAQRKRRKENPEKYAKERHKYYWRDPDAAKAKQRKRYAEDPEKYRAQKRKWSAGNKEKIRAYARLRAYGVTEEQLAVIRLKQGNKCPVCWRLLAEVNEHVDHCHGTGIVRGILCAECNKAEGILRKAAGSDLGLADALQRLHEYLGLGVA